MTEFHIQEEHLRSVLVEKTMSIMLARPNGHKLENVPYKSFEDTPEFTALRDTLERQGFIHTQRSYHNGDLVIKPFKLNNTVFNEGDKFPSAAALKNFLK